MPPDSIDLPRLQSQLCLGHVELHATLASTQDRAQELIAGDEAGCRLPLLVLAEEQTAGRGRGSNRWWTGRGSIALSLAFDPADWGLARRAAPLRSLVAAVALVDVLRERLPDQTIGLHWPNDVLVAQRKIAGILLDVAARGVHVLGIGLNVNNSLAEAPAELRDSATSLCDLTDSRHDRTVLLVNLIESIERTMRASDADPASFGRRFDELCLQVGRQLTIDSAGQRLNGRCAGIAADGALLLDTPDGRRALYTGVVCKA